MATKAPADPETNTTFISIGPVLAGWLLPGGGHFIQRRWGRGALLLSAISLLYFLGMAMQGRFFSLTAGSLVDTLGFLGDLCSGMLYISALFMGYEAPVSPAPAADFGTKFLLVAGLLNVLCILDAHDIAIGRKD